MVERCYFYNWLFNKYSFAYGYVIQRLLASLSSSLSFSLSLSDTHSHTIELWAVLKVTLPFSGFFFGRKCLDEYKIPEAHSSSGSGAELNCRTRKKKVQVSFGTRAWTMQKTDTEAKVVGEAAAPKPNGIGLINQQKKISDKTLCMLRYQNMTKDWFPETKD